MTGRNYDVVLQFANNISESYSNYPAIQGKFESGNVVVGTSSGAVGTIANINLQDNTIKVKYSNTFERFTTSDNLESKVIIPLIHNTSVTYDNSNATAAATVNSADLGAFNAQLTDIRIATRLGPTTNTLLLPISANSNSEITVIVDNAQLHQEDYIWTNDLQLNENNVSHDGHISDFVTIGGSNTISNLASLGANAVFIKNTIGISENTFVTVRVDSANLQSTAFSPANANISASAVTANSTSIVSIANSPFIAEKNAFTQNPIVRLISIYYPGDYYPPNKFGNPSFSGIGQSAHYLTIDEQERTRKEKIYEDAQDALEEAEREADNTVLSKFIRNLESRIYSTLAKDISESLFNYGGNRPDFDDPTTWVSGTINLEGNTLTWINNGSTITLIIEEYLDGVLISTTEIVIPIGSFGGCWIECDG